MLRALQEPGRSSRVCGSVAVTGGIDLGILDLTIAVADANNWARLPRLAGLPGELGYADWNPHPLAQAGAR